MRRIAIGLVGSALAVVAAGGLLTSARVQAADGEGLSSFFQPFLSPAQPAYSAPPAQQATPAASPLDGSYGRWQGRLQRDRRGLAQRDRSRAYEAARKLKTHYVSLPKAGTVGSEETKPKAADEKAAELAKAGEIQAALLQDSTLRAGDIVITSEGPKVFVGRERDRHRAADFEDAVRSRRIDDKTRRLLAAMVAPRGALAADEARKLVAKLRRPGPGRQLPTDQEVVLVTGSAAAAPRVISTVLSGPSSRQPTAKAQ